MANAAQNEASRDILQAAREASGRRMMSRFLRKLYAVTVIAVVLNFLLFMAGAFYLGGDAVNGKAEDGRYYLWGYHAGKKGYTEVSKAVFDYSRWHVYSVMVTWPLMILAGFASKTIGKHTEA